MRFSPSTKVALVVLATLVTAIASWWSVYPDRGDTKGPRYVLWKLGFFSFDPDVVYQGMVGDLQRDELAVGLTVPELKRRFGSLRTREESTFEYQKYYADRVFVGKQIYWLGDSPWLVVLESGRVIELHLMKG